MGEVINYLFFGIITTAINIITFQLFIKCSINYEIATVLAWIISVIFAFITNRRYVFKSKNEHDKKLIKEFFNFIGARILSLGIDLICMYICIDLLIITPLLAKLISNIIVVIFNYIISKFYIFK